MPPLFPLTLSLYAVSCTLSCVPVIAETRFGGGQALAAMAPGTPSSPGTLQQAARWMLALAFVSQALDIAWLCLHGRHPAVDGHEATYFITWLISGLFLLLPLRYAPSVVNALAVPVIPLVMVLQVLARLSPSALRGGALAPGGGLSLLATTHILCATLGSAIFIVAAGSSVLYLLSERRLKRRAPLSLNARRGVSLEGLDAMNRLCVTLGFPVFTAALITGTVWIGHRSALGQGPESATAAYLQPQYVMAVLTWLVYGLLLLSRLVAGVRGRRAALATLAGFLTTMSVLMLYLFRGRGGL